MTRNKGIKALPGMGDDDTKAAAASNKKEYGGVRGKYAFVDYAFSVDRKSVGRERV